MKRNYLEQLTQFLMHSNYIEREYSSGAFYDALGAWNYLDGVDELNKEEILVVHKILMNELNPRIAGRFRSCDVRVGNQVCPSFLQVNELLEKWMEMHSKAKTEEEIKLAHIVFESIHPFEDGNGRVGRIIYNWQRTKNELPVHVIHEGDEQMEYYKWFDDKKNI